MDVRQYKLLSVVDNVIEGVAPQEVQPTPITPATVVTLDAHRLLALPVDVALPIGFNDP
ncbi:hypothetical protein As57867_005748, partial [Aphanomyces stellatus]